MFDLVYGQTYTMKVKYLAALLDMFNPAIVELPEDEMIDAMLEAEYIAYDKKEDTFYLEPVYQNLVDSFLKARATVNIEAPRVQAMGATLSMYYLDKCRHMLVLLYENEGEDGFAEIAISDKKTSPTRLFEILGGDFGREMKTEKMRAKSYDADHLPNVYKEDFDDACKKNALFRVTLYDQNEDGSDGSVAVFAAFPHKTETIWLTAMRQNLFAKQKPIVVQELSEADYQKQLAAFFNMFSDSVWE